MEAHFDYCIIGAGPAGLQLGYYFEQAARSYVIFESGTTPAESFKRYPRHERLISINKLYTGCDDPETNLRWDWNSLLSDNPQRMFKDYSRKYFPNRSDMVRYLTAFAQDWNLKIRYNHEIVQVAKEEGPESLFHLTARTGEVHTCRRLIVATGLQQPFIPAIPGIELTENYANADLDPARFTNQRVLIIGKGNSGFETAEALTEYTAIMHVASATPLRFAWKTHFIGHLRAVNNNFLDTYQLKQQNGVLDVRIEGIRRREDGLGVTVNWVHAPRERQELVYDHVIVCAGFRFDDSIYGESCRPALAINDRFPAQRSNWESTNVESLYIAGTLTQMRDYKKVASAFVDGFRYNARALFHLLNQKFHGIEWPSVGVAPADFVQHIIDRLARTSALWAQFGFLCDVLHVQRDGTSRYFYELPVDYLLDGGIGKLEECYSITLEYGEQHGDPFNSDRITQSDSDNAHLSFYLHPVVRHYRDLKLVSEHHIVENLENQWTAGVHVEPLRKYLAGDSVAVAQSATSSHC